MTQPLSDFTLTRPWHWGIAVVGDPTAEVPSSLEGHLALASERVVVLRVRHAQDIEADRFEGDWDWAVATIHVRTLVAFEPTDRTILCDVLLNTPADRISIGDADGDIVLSGHGSTTRLVVSADDADPTGLEEAWIDLLPVG